MATFVLVHGGFQGGWSFTHLARELRRRGHDVFTPTLTGLGERSHLRDYPINLDTHIQDVENLIRWEDLLDVVLLGHSYGGMVITGVAERLAERISTLVYLDAVVPDDGDNLISIRGEFSELFLSLVSSEGGRFIAPFPAAEHEAKASAHAWLDAKTVAHPFACFLQAISLQGRYREIGRRVLIHAADGFFGPYYERFRGTIGSDIHAIEDSGHSLQIDQPKRVADIICRNLGHAD